MIFRIENVTPEGIPTNIPKDTVWNSNLEIDSNDTYVLTGTSGRGKSTFLHILSGIRKNFTGNLYLDGNNTKIFTTKKWAEIRQDCLAIVFQDLRLIPHLTARQNLTLKSALKPGLSTEQIDSYASHLDVMECLNKKCLKLSYGQQQRIAIIRALIQPFQFLLVDEPFSHLDPDNITRSLELIKDVAGRNESGILLTTLNDDYGFTANHNLQV